jgi:hypothetical protein
MAVLAALPGFIDWLHIPAKTKAKRTGVAHLSFNMVVLVVFAANSCMLYGQWHAVPPPICDGPFL